MKILRTSRRHYYVAIVSIILIMLVTVALIAGMVGCGGRPAVDAIEIRDWYDLYAIGNNLSADYILMNHLDATTAGYAELASPTANEGKGWQPIGTGEFPAFQGLLDGQGYEIRNLFINRPGEDKVGLFNQVHWPAVVRNLGIVDATVTGSDFVGILGGGNWNIVVNCYFSGDVTGNEDVGGVVGSNRNALINSHSSGSVIGNAESLHVGGLAGFNTGTVTSCHSSVTVNGDKQVGGLVGTNLATIDKSYSTGAVYGNDYVGGLVAANLQVDETNIVSNSYSTGAVYGNYGVGGLVGSNNGTVSDSYASGNVSGSAESLHVGGLAGYNDGTISNSHSTGRVYGVHQVGGLVGTHKGAINNSYSTGNVTGGVWVGGLVGIRIYEFDPIIVSNSFWDKDTSGQATSDGGTGKNTTEMQDIATFTDTETEGLDEPWDMTAVDPGETDDGYIWNIVDGVTYPFLSWQSVS